MAQPSVAREPSMEEILASIRRIIESNETGPAGAFSGQLPPVYDDEDEAAREAAFVAEPISPPARVPPAANQAFGARPAQDFSPISEGPMAERQESAAEKTMSLADVAARVRAAADRNAAMGPQAFAAQAQRGAAETATSAAAPTVSQPLSAPSSERAATQRPTDVRPLMAAAAAASVSEQPASSVNEQPVSFAAEDRAAAAAIESASSAENRFDQLSLRGALETPLTAERFDIAVLEPVVEKPGFDLAEPQAKDEAGVEGGLSLNLLSAAAGAQIARSFSELAEVFDGVERRSIEDMAAEMLRPMLQDWLEDNLPTLVERLVREEIERVARGSRR
ncbi:cell division protein PopZ [Agrobacterium sp. ST15.13.015]|uniref:cell division protein PopZ n=1 Tax=Agrobacterium sp. ST15.13.015 TaxID=3017319 RepID=UPI0022BFED91|nr:cell division protein PopZ [Agrobacterium sp. ST15.13.015]MCZ7500608.1 cell division protein PopZ [Rhizobium rhizogenes]